MLQSYTILWKSPISNYRSLIDNIMIYKLTNLTFLEIEISLSSSFLEASVIRPSKVQISITQDVYFMFNYVNKKMKF